jgi:hypothetical protein
LGIRVDNAASVQITGNFVAGDERPISVGGNPTSTATVDHNTLVVLSDTLGQTGGIYLQGATGDVSRNLITPSAANTDPGTSGIFASGPSTGGTLRLSRNRILGFAITGNRGVDLSGTGQHPVTMSDDLIAGNWSGVQAFTTVPTISLTNETIWGSTNSELSLTDTTAASIDSSIIGDAGVPNNGGTATCTSSFSRGPSAVGICGPYATNATPAFVDSSHPDPTLNDYHLTPANPSLIDMGNPAGPAPGELDLDGGPRALDAIANGSCAPRRDIGAYEVVANNSDCNPPNPAPPAAGPTFQLLGTKVKIGRPGTGLLGFLCSGPASDQCTLAGTLSAGGASKHSLARSCKAAKLTTVGAVTGTVAGGKSATITVRLTKRGLKLLRRKRKLAATLTGTVTNNAKVSAPITAPLTLKAKR